MRSLFLLPLFAVSVGCGEKSSSEGSESAGPRYFHCTLDSALCVLIHPRCAERGLLAVSILSPLAGQALGDPAGKFVFRLLGGGDGGSVDFGGVAEFLDGSQGKHADQQVGIVDMLDQ